MKKKIQIILLIAILVLTAIGVIVIFKKDVLTDEELNTEIGRASCRERV